MGGIFLRCNILYPHGRIFVVAHLNALDNLGQDILNATPADSELDFQKHIVEQTRSQGYIVYGLFMHEIIPL